MSAEPLLSALVVDDDYRIAQLHSRCVEQQEGYRLAGTAHTARQALALARERRPDLVLLDVYLPDRSGIEVVQGARAAKLPCDFILITAARELPVIEESFRAGIFDYLIKPFALDLLQEALRKYRLFRAHLHSTREPDQEFVESLKTLRGASVVPAAPPAPKGIDARTLERIGQVLREVEEPSSAEHVARRAGVSRSTARAYLHHLVERGEAEELLRYGTVGRPQVLYKPKPPR